MNRIILIILAVSLTGLSHVAGAQEEVKRDGCRAFFWSLYTEGGVTCVNGLGMKDVHAAPFMDMFPEFGVGVTFNINHLARLGFNYDWSGFNREQRFDNLESVSLSENPDRQDGQGIVERTEGIAYNKMSTRYHAIDLTAEFNVMKIMNRVPGHRFNLYVGVGGGYMFSHGNKYTISMSQEHIVNGNSEESSVWLNAKNNHKDWGSVYIPASLSVEYNISPIITVGLCGDCKCLFKDRDYAPSVITTTAAVFRINLLGKRHGYSSVKSKLRESRAENEALRKELSKLRGKHGDIQ